MKKIIPLIFISAVFMLITGCSKHGGNDDFIDNDLGPIMNNYVCNYIKPVKLFLPDDSYQKEDCVYTQYVFFSPCRNTPYNNGEVLTYEMANQFEYENLIHDIGYYEYNDDKYPPIREHLLRYDSLCKAHKDTEYSKKEKFHSGDQIGIVTYRRMTLDVTSDTQYDAAHPAGTSLADIIEINVYSAKEIIESGYDISLCGKMKNDKGYEFHSRGMGHELKMPLKQFNEEYRKLIRDGIYLDFKTAPDVTSTHRFTVTYRDEDGRVLTATAAPVTLQGKGGE